MRTYSKILCLLLALFLLLNLAGCKEEPTDTKPTKGETTAPTESTGDTTPTQTDPTQPTQTDPPPTEPDNQAAELYAEASAKLAQNTNLRMKISRYQTLTLAGEEFPSSSEQDISYLGLGTDNITAMVEETATFGEYETDIEEIFADGTAYASVFGSDYRSAMTAEEYTARYLPIVLVDPTLYGTITAETSDNGTVITFEDASILESWLDTDMAELIQAAAKVVLDSRNTVTQVHYAAQYKSAGAHFDVWVKVDYSQPTTASISAPKDADSHIQLTWLDAPRMVEQVYGYLQCGEKRSFSQSITTYSDAAAVYLSSGFTMNTYGTGNSIQYHSDYSFYAMDYYNEEEMQYTMEELFRDGKYTVSYDGGTPETNRGVTADMVSDSVMGYMTEYVFDCAYFTDAVCTDLGSLLLIEFTGSQELGESICREINTDIFGDENYLDDYATAYSCDQATYYVAVDRYLGLPTALGFYYEGTHTIDGYEYYHFRQMDQAVYLASLDAYEAINEVSAPDNAPETNATPAFYHVTGPNGQEMWLLGTIHVGDDRTGSLPQEIYDAYNAADALAVECNTRAFDKEAEEDEELQEQVSEFYYYEDTTAEDHIDDEELYKKAVQLMKATGSYFHNASYLKLPMWSNSMDNYLLQQCYTLSPDKGVDNRLLMMAEADGKKILEVESCLFQIEMMTSWSEELSMEMLKESLEPSLPEYYVSISEMYEMWCAGDEAAIIEYLKEDTSELTEEELVLYNEYNKAMSWDRNIGMTEVAIEYLESGETVFYAVGLAHVLAEDGLVNTLRAAGYTVELVEYN